jgi:hypothetical protein
MNANLATIMSPNGKYRMNSYVSTGQETPLDLGGRRWCRSLRLRKKPTV